MSWTWDAEQLRELLTAAGYDVGPRDPRRGTDGSLTARRERGLESSIVAVDAGGRVRLTVVQERESNESRQLNIAEGALDLVVTLQRTMDVSGHLHSVEQFLALIDLDGAAIAGLAAYAGDSTASQGNPAPEDSSENRPPPPWWARAERQRPE